MSWVLASGGRVVEWTGSAPLGSEVSIGEPLPGIVVGSGGPRGGQDEFPGDAAEILLLRQNLVDQGSRLRAGDPSKFDQHFKDHRQLLERANGKAYPVTPAGKTEFLHDLGRYVAAHTLQPVGLGTLAKGQPIVCVFKGSVGMARLTMIMRPGGIWQTLIRSGEGMDLKIMYLLRFDAKHPFVF
ncbi:MAG TPA: hypothetical protein VG826_26815 [Pirellulales bacterium]|nr:hypothetical protein [Pirellulales bacterium]